MLNKTVEKLIKIANILDIRGNHLEANRLTKIAEDLSEELITLDYDDRLKFLDKYLGSIIAFIRFKDKETGATMYQTVMRIKNKVSMTEPSDSIKDARKEFYDICDKFPRTPYLDLPEFEKHRPGKTKKSPDYEGNEWGYQGNYSGSKYRKF